MHVIWLIINMGIEVKFNKIRVGFFHVSLVMDGRTLINQISQVRIKAAFRFTKAASASTFSFFFFFSRVLEECGYCSLNSSRKCWLFNHEQCTLFNHEQCICALFMDPQISLFSNFFIKNGSHDTIHTFKNYFATMFSIFSFQFQQNNFCPNKPKILLSRS